MTPGDILYGYTGEMLARFIEHQRKRWFIYGFVLGLAAASISRSDLIKPSSS